MKQRLKVTSQTPQQTLAGHTPGPWEYRPGVSPRVVANNGLVICDTQSKNANLIAAAPEMLALLERINHAFYVKNSSKALREVMAETKPLLQKARGEV